MKHLYRGYGKGKTTAALGLTVRMVSADKSVLWLSCLKDGSSSEIKWLHKNTCLRLYKFKDFAFQMSNSEKKKVQLEIIEFINAAKKEFYKYDLIVLDEFIDLIDVEFLSVAEVYDYLKDITAEVVVTGHREYLQLLELFDYDTEFKKHKHPFDKKIKARLGIEF
ncbi:MAG: cob(I)yrinic acid a,c-diamide adenosyltransferase [Erysipelotrichaceae bacterium]